MNARDDDRLRDLLDHAVSDVEPTHGLDAIRSRTKVHPVSNRPWLLGVGAAVVATAATIAAFAVIDHDAGTTSTGPVPAASPSQAVASADDSPSADDSASADTSAAPAPTRVSLPVYYIGQTGRGPRLYREFHPVSTDDPLSTALAAAVGSAPDGGSSAPLDPDYRTGWPALTSASGEVDGDQIVVNLGGDPESSLHDRPAGMSADEAEMAVQQLVYTAQAVTQTSDPVQFLLWGKHTDTLLGVPVSEPVSRADGSSTLAQVWIIDPVEGAEVPSGFEVSGIGAFFEANVTWELRQGDQVVKSGFATAAECCRMAPYSFTVDAPAGDYTLVVKDEDASGGEGFPPFEDSKDITIR